MRNELLTEKNDARVEAMKESERTTTCHGATSLNNLSVSVAGAHFYSASTKCSSFPAGHSVAEEQTKPIKKDSTPRCLFRKLALSKKKQGGYGPALRYNTVVLHHNRSPFLQSATALSHSQTKNKLAALFLPFGPTFFI